MKQLKHAEMEKSCKDEGRISDTLETLQNGPQFVSIA